MMCLAQHRLLTEHFGIQELKLVTGWSMGAQQTYEWAIRYPEYGETRSTYCRDS